MAGSSSGGEREMELKVHAGPAVWLNRQWRTRGEVLYHVRAPQNLGSWRNSDEGGREALPACWMQKTKKSPVACATAHLRADPRPG